VLFTYLKRDPFTVQRILRFAVGEKSILKGLEKDFWQSTVSQTFH